MFVEVRNGPESDFSARLAVARVDLMPAVKRNDQEVTRTRKAHFRAYIAEIEAMK
jgi:hypothetical protein